jgi:glucose-6-phosphate 1-dehydrogenase
VGNTGLRHDAVRTFLAITKVKKAWKFTSTPWYTGAGKRLIFTPHVTVEMTELMKQRQNYELGENSEAESP